MCFSSWPHCAFRRYHSKLSIWEKHLRFYYFGLLTGGLGQKLSAMAPTRSPRSRFSPNSVRYQRVNQEIEFSQIEEITNEMLPSERHVWHDQIQVVPSIWGVLKSKRMVEPENVFLILWWKWMLQWCWWLKNGDNLRYCYYQFGSNIIMQMTFRVC